MNTEPSGLTPQINFENSNLIRDAAEITLARINNYQELWAETEQKGDEKFIQKTKEVWKDFAVHGILGFDKKENKNKLLNFTDLDGKCSLALLRLAKLNTNNVEYLTPGESVKGKINIDTGYRHGLVVEDNGRTVFMDHHGEQSKNDLSATKVVYETLTSVGLLKKEPYLDNLVEFVTLVDNKNYPDSKENFFKSDKTIIGLQRFIDPSHLIKFFRAGRNPTEVLTPEELSKMGLSQASEKQRETIVSSVKRINELKDKGAIISSKNYGQIVIDVGNTLKGGFDIVKAFGYGGYIIWNPQENSFFINTVNKLSDVFYLKQGKRIRDNMWVKPKQSEPITVELTEVVEKLVK